jgi:signal transduction histidine kinase
MTRFRTLAFRHALIAATTFFAAGIIVLLFLYWTMLGVIDRQVDGALGREALDLTAAFEHDGYDGLRRTVQDRMSPHEGSVRLYRLQGPGGDAVGNLDAWPSHEPALGQTTDMAMPDGRSARVRVLDFGIARLAVGRDLSERHKFQTIFRESLLGAVMLNLVLGLAAGLMTGKTALRRLGVINRAMDEVLHGRLETRVETIGHVAPRDEYDLLAHNLNAMLDRLQRLVGTVRGVTENIAHDLRTPLNRLRSRLELALLTPRPAAEYEVAIQRAIGEADAIIATFNAMLKIARIEAGAVSPQHEPVEMSDVVEELADLYQPLAEENGVALVAEIQPNLAVLGDGHLISQAAANLLDNALKYAPPGGRVVLSLRQEAAGVRLEVADNGPGIPADKRAAVVDRFVRLDASRHRPGSGLGLSLVAAVAEWHGAALSLNDNQPGLRASLLFRAVRR